MLKRSTSMSIYTPYTYLIRHIPTNTHYYGVRWKNVRLKKTPEEDLWVTYFTRSKKVQSLINEYGKDSFEFEIRKKFQTIDQARLWETKVLKRMRVLDNPQIWLNRTNNISILNESHPRGTFGKKWKNQRTTERNQVEKLSNQYTKGTFWIHNEFEKRMIPVGTEIPAGFARGTGRTNKRPDLALRNKLRSKRSV
jgi:hypothetical protein